MILQASREILHTGLRKEILWIASGLSHGTQAQRRVSELYEVPGAEVQGYDLKSGSSFFLLSGLH